MSISLHPHRFSPIAKLTFVVASFSLIILGAFSLANSLSELDTIENFLFSYGYLTVLAVGIVAGFNLVVPVPAAAFVPVFTEAGMFLPTIILLLVIGTTIADMIGFGIGHIGRHLVADKHPKFYRWLENIHHNHTRLILPIVIMYASFAPLPNEVILIPLALMGTPFRIIFLAILIGNTVNQTMLAYGFGAIFNVLF